MLKDRIWVDASAEIEFWQQMAQLETASSRLSSMGRWAGLLGAGPRQRAALHRDIEAIRDRAQELVDRHTVLATPAPSAIASGTPNREAETQAGDSLRTLARMVVSLRQDRNAGPGVEEEKIV